MFCVFNQNRRPWWPLRRCGVSTFSMAASIGIEWSPGCASSGDAPHIAPPHPHGCQNCHPFACIFCRVDFVVGHNYKLKTMVWLRVTNMFISMLSTYLYNMGARRGLWMLFWPPFLTACVRFVKNTGNSRIKLIMRLFYCFILNQAKAFLPNPFRIGCHC